MSKRHSNITRLSALIESCIETDPFERDGFKWAAMPPAWYCEQLGISESTFRRLTSKPPFVRRSPHKDGRKTTILRTGTDVLSERDVANICSRIWRNHKKQAIENSKNAIVRRHAQNLKPNPTKHEYGCIMLMIRTWSKTVPMKEIPSLFSGVIGEWGFFMIGAKIHPEWQENRYFSYPNLNVMARFRDVALDVYEDLKQGQYGYEMAMQKQKAGGEWGYA